MTYSVTAIILKRETWRDTARIYTLFTREHGKILAIGRGTRKTTSKLAAHLEPFSLSELLLARGRKIETICGAVLKRQPEPLAGDERAYVAAAFAAEVVDQLVKAGERDEELWSLIEEHFSALASDADAGRMTASFIWSFMERLGYRPKLDACASCEGPAAFGGLFLPLQGTIICLNCRPGEERLVGALPLDAGIAGLSAALAFLEARLDRPLASLSAFRAACQPAPEGVQWGQQPLGH
jgi:DNA repair protein RecO (recombination protein O)